MPADMLKLKKGIILMSAFPLFWILGGVVTAIGKDGLFLVIGGGIGIIMGFAGFLMISSSHKLGFILGGGLFPLGIGIFGIISSIISKGLFDIESSHYGTELNISYELFVIGVAIILLFLILDKVLPKESS